MKYIPDTGRANIPISTARLFPKPMHLQVKIKNWNPSFHYFLISGLTHKSRGSKLNKNNKNAYYT